MTRFLSLALQAQEPYFRLGLQRLEAANGKPNTDIRFSHEVKNHASQKLLELGLDPKDTTAKELYKAVEQKISSDDAELSRYLQTQSATHISAEADVVAGMAHVIQNLPDSKRCFAIKGSVVKSIMKRNPPKKAMKGLGYRSIDSFLKHEQPALVMAAAWISEGPAWHKKLIEQYKKLSAQDFDSRTIQILYPTSKRWQSFAETAVLEQKHNLISFKELGAIILLPLPKNAPNGAVTVSFCLALHELNEIRAASSFLKLCQVKPDFGHSVAELVQLEPQLNSMLVDQPLPWHLVQQYYSRLTDRFREEVFGPHIQVEDMVWQPVEDVISKLVPSFKFWQHTSHLGFLDHHKPVSLNLIDAAISFCNRLPYELRTVHYFQKSLWHELMLRYLNHKPMEETIIGELQPELAPEAASL